MRKVLTAVTVGALSGAAMLAGAASPTDNVPEARAYLNFDFGGTRALPRNFHYGLRLDRDSRYATIPVPFMQLDFDAKGTLKSHLNGMPVMRRSLIATQGEIAAEGAEAAAADASANAGFEAAATEAAPADAAGSEVAAEGAAESIPVEEVGAEAGATAAYTAADWGLIALGAAGVAYAGYEVSKSSDDAPAGSGGGSTGGGSTTGGSTTGGSTSGSPLGGILLGLSDMEKLGRNSSNPSREYIEWLDGGTGHMGDLEAAR